MTARLACLYVPGFALAARLRSDPSLKEQPVALVDGRGAHALVVDAGAAARAAGIRPGFSLAQARALLPAVALKSRDLEAERAAQAALVETAEAFSPRVEDAGPGLVFLDMCNERNESMLVELAVRRARLAGLRIQAGVAGGKTAARVAAEEAADGPVVIPPGEEAAWLAPLPFARLGPSDAVLEMVGRWGLRTAGAFAALPERDVIARLGKEGWDLHRAARGEDPRPLVPRAHAPRYAEGVSFDWPVLDLGTFLAVARGLLDRLCARLAAQDLAILKLGLALRLDPSGEDARVLDLPAPTRDVPSMLDLLALDLERTPPAEPIVGVSFWTLPERPKRAQLSLFDPPALSPDALNAALSRLAALVGPDRVGSPRPVAGRRPEAFAMEPFTATHDAAASDLAPPAGTGGRALLGEAEPPTPRGSSRIAVRTLRPPVALEVRRGAGESGPFSVRSVRNDGSQPEIVGQVRVASGPWRVEEGWWMGEPIARDYWDVELTDGALYRLYFDPRRGAWFADGIYD